MDKVSGAPIAGAFVVMHVDGMSLYQGDQCYRVQTAESGADGTFVVKPWAELPLGQRHEKYYVYKPGYVVDRAGSAGLRLNMTRQDGTASQRLQQLNDLARALPCAGEPSADVVHIFELIASEARGLPITAQERQAFFEFINAGIEMEREAVGAKERRAQ